LHYSLPEDGEYLPKYVGEVMHVENL